MKNFFKSIGSSIANYFWETDKVILSLAIIASTLSCLLIIVLYPEAISTMKPVYTQIVSCFMGIVIAIIISTIDYKTIAKHWKFYVPLGLIPCFLLFTPLGEYRGGDGMGSDIKNWLNIGFTKIQPAEFLKAAFILSFSYHCHKVKKNINQPKTLLLLLAHAVVPLIAIGNSDLGTKFVFAAIAVFILFAAGINWKFVLAGIGGFAAFLVPFWYLILPTYLKNRFEAVYNLDDEIIKKKDGMQQYQGRLTLGSGGISGKGLRSDNLLFTTPELHNDMMFCHIGQVFGFVGCFGVVVWFVLLGLRLLQNAKNSADDLGTFINVGVFAAILTQFIFNVGMTVCLLPVVGVTLPFWSAGGSSAISTYLLVGLALSVHNHTPKSNLF